MKKYHYSNIVICIPVYKEKMTSFELISFIQCLKILNNYDIFLVAPISLDTSAYIQEADIKNIKVKSFDNSFFKDTNSYNKLLMSCDFYNSFIDYSYMLIYQLDCFIFKDNLIEWCNKNYNYIGAPFPSFSEPYKYLTKKVGNGGFSIRHIQSHYEISKNFRIRIKDIVHLEHNIGRKKKILIFAINILEFITQYKFKNYLSMIINFNEDIFWSNWVDNRYENFKVPSYFEAIAFSIETNPHQLWLDNKKELPLGCHAWEKYDLLFWKPFIESFGHKIIV